MRIGIALVLAFVTAACADPSVSPGPSPAPLRPPLETEPKDRAALVESTIVGADLPLIVSRPDEVSQKYVKMAASPFGFLRGNIAVFDRDFGVATDLSGLPSGWTILQNDPHPENLGTLGQGPSLTAGWNDYDGSRLGPAAHDVLRGAIAIAVFTDQVTGGPSGDAVRAFLEGYRAADPGSGGRILADVLASAQTLGPARDELSAVKSTNDGPRFKRSGPRIDVTPEVAAALIAALPAYGTTRLAGAPALGDVRDVVQVVGKGVGSLPMRRYWLLIAGPADDGSEDTILQAKEAWDRAAGASTLAVAEATVSGARADGPSPALDPDLGWLTADGASFVVTTVSAWQQGVDADTVAAGFTAGAYDDGDLASLARFAGGSLARAHQRGGAWGSLAVDPDAAVPLAASWAWLTERDAAIFRSLLVRDGPLLGSGGTGSASAVIEP